MKSATRRQDATTDEDIEQLQRIFTAKANPFSVQPPKAIPGKKWAMVDSGSQPNVTNASKEFPGHPVKESEAQRNGVMYKAADGSLIPNLGEIDIVHVEPDGERYKMTLQNAPVHCTILSVRELVTKGCRVTFHSRGGHIRYPSGKKISFTIKDGVFFVPLNVLPPECENIFGQVINPGRGFARPGRQ